MKKKKENVYKNVDSLVQGIEAILSGNRCSFSEEEIALLADVVGYLKEAKQAGNNNPIDWKFVMQSIRILIHVFTGSDTPPSDDF